MIIAVATRPKGGVEDMFTFYEDTPWRPEPMDAQIPSPSLVVLIGPSGSGKSTWANSNFRANEIVSTDSLRAIAGTGEDDQQASKAAFDLLEIILTQRLSRRLTTVLDSIGLDPDLRRHWIAKAKDNSIPSVAVRFETALEVCLQRNEERETPRPKAVVRKQHRRAQDSFSHLAEEGFGAVISPSAIAAVATEVASAMPISGLSEDSDTGHGFGLSVSRFNWGTDRSAIARTLTSVAQRAEKAGFKDIWLMDHFRQIPQVGRPWEDILDSHIALGFMAAATTTIRLGTLVAPVTHRHPSVFGQAMATLDVLSSGRVNCGIGLGWDKKEHLELGIPFPETETRYKMLEDALQLLPLLWGSGTPDFQGHFIKALKLSCYPRPIQEQIPILVGGSGERRTLRLVAQYADMANLYGTPQVVGHKVDVLQSHLNFVERNPAEVVVSHSLGALISESGTELRERVDQLRTRNQSPEELVNRYNGSTVEGFVDLVAEYRSRGADHTIVAIPDAHQPGSIESFGRVIERMP